METHRRCKQGTSLEREMRSLLGRAAPLITDSKKRLKHDSETVSWRQCWARHVGAGSRLLHTAHVLRAGVMSDGLRSLWRDLEASIRTSQPLLERIAAAIPGPVRPMETQSLRSQLRIGIGNPNTLGCSDMAGTAVRLWPLVDESLGVVAAIRRLHLDIMAMPAARLKSYAAEAIRGDFIVDVV